MDSGVFIYCIHSLNSPLKWSKKKQSSSKYIYLFIYLFIHLFSLPLCFSICLIFIFYFLFIHLFICLFILFLLHIKNDIGRIRTYAPDGNCLAGSRLDHSATMSYTILDGCTVSRITKALDSQK